MKLSGTTSAAKAPLRIAVVANYFPSTSQTFVLDHVTGLIERGHQIRVFANSRAPEAVSHLDHQAYDLPRVTHYWPPPATTTYAKVGALLRGLWSMPPARSTALLREQPVTRNALGASAALLRRVPVLTTHLPRPDIVHVHFGHDGEKMAWLKAHGAISGRLVVSLHGFDVNQVLASGETRYAMLFRHADRIVATTQFMSGQILALGCPRDKLAQNPIGIRTARFPFAERRWNPPDELRVLTVARLVEFKGIEVALRAVARIVEAGVRVRYTIVGTGPLRGQLERLAHELGIREVVTFQGAQSREEIVRQFQSTHLFVLPSHTAADGAQEGQGIVLQEAQACGIPVLATRHGGIPEGCENGISGVLVREKDDEALAAGLQELIDRRQEWGKMGRAGRTLVETRFDLAAHLDRTEQLYRAVLADSYEE